jgi:4'-phosphopantetheinyl transferase
MSGRLLTVHCTGPVTGELTAPRMSSGQGITIHVATLEELADRAVHYTSLLDGAETARMQRFKFDADRERFLLGHGFLRDVLGRHLDQDGAALTFERGPHGKPFLRDASVHFNLSDTKDAVAIAIGREQDLGVDIETMARHVDHERVADHYFTAEEQGSISEAVDGKRRFLEFWTRKEAMLKASGVGIMDDLRVLRVDQALNRMTITHDVFMAMAAPEYHVRTWHVHGHHIISLATPHSTTHIDLVGIAS